MALKTIRNYAELMRVANVFTAVSNVWMGMILTTGHLPGWTAGAISLSSALLYLAGMVLNDVFDHELDARERPERPIPSGRVSLTAARTLGWGLLASGIAFAALASYWTPDKSQYPLFAAVVLAGCIVFYNAWAKKTLMLSGPIMGMCRAANVMLGCSVAPMAAWPISPIPAWGIGIYIMGVTQFARSEAGQSKRASLLYATITISLGLALLIAMPWLPVSGAKPLQIDATGWGILWLVVAGAILRRIVLAILQPKPRNVQRAVGNAVLSVITIDAALCLGFADPFWACAVLALVAPAMLLSLYFKVS